MSDKFRKRVLWVCVLVAVCGFACKKTATRPRYTKDGLFIVRLATPMGYSENQIADALGYWKEEGLQPEYVGTLSAAEEIPAALSEKIDVLGGHPNGVVRARLAGAKIIAVVNGMVDDEENPHIVYHVRRSSGLQRIDDFRELAKRRPIRIAVAGRNSCSDWYFDEWLLAGGIPENALDWQIMPAKQQLEALSQGLVDVVTTHPPFIKAADADPAFYRVLSSYDIVRDPAAGASVRGFTEKFIKEHPEAAAAFVRVYTRAHEWSNAHPKEARELFGRLFKLKPEQVSIFTFNRRRWIDDSDINPWLLRQIAHKDLKPEQVVQAGSIYTNELNVYWKEAGRPSTFAPLAPQERRASEPVPRP